MKVRFPARRWDLAHDVIEELKENPPNGYRLISSQVNRKGATRSGHRCNIKLLFRYVDHRVEPLNEAQGRRLFIPYATQASGVMQS